MLVQVHFGLNNFSANKPVVTIGTFDGVHRGHRSVIAELKSISAKTGGESVVFTFSPHPRMIVSPKEDSIRLLTSDAEKIMLFNELSIDHLVVFPFTREFSKMCYRDFVTQILVEKMKLHLLVTGYDHKFGHDRIGDYEALAQLSKLHSFEVDKLNPLLVEDVAVSSTKIRESLESGNIERANHFLGYDYLLQGKVVEGEKLGRQIGFPTANIQPEDNHKLIPGNGVYAVMVTIEGVNYKGMLNVGTRPTVNSNVDHRSIEVNILDFDQDIYGKKIVVHFMRWIREEVKFANLEMLKIQLGEDREKVREMLAISY